MHPSSLNRVLSIQWAAYDPATVRTMTSNELAERAGVPAPFVERLIELGIVSAGPGGGFTDADVYRVRFVRSSERGGLSVEAIARAIREGRFSLQFFEGPQYRWASLSDRTYGEVADQLDLPVDFVLSFEEALGKVRPTPEDPAPGDLAAMLEFSRLSLSAGVDPRAHLRLIRVYADALRRIAETEGEVFHRFIEVPRLAAGLSHGAMLDEIDPIGAELTPRMEAVLMGVYRRQQERVWTDDGVQHMEAAIEAMGLYERPDRPTAFAFLDLTGYTRLTEERGDQAAAELAAALTQLVDGEVGRHDGKAVKWLGDGVMFVFRDPAAAVRSTLEIGRRTGEVGLPRPTPASQWGRSFSRTGTTTVGRSTSPRGWPGSPSRRRPWSTPRSSGWSPKTPASDSETSGLCASRGWTTSRRSRRR